MNLSNSCPSTLPMDHRDVIRRDVLAALGLEDPSAQLDLFPTGGEA